MFVFYQFIYLAPRVVYQRLGILSPALTSHLRSPSDTGASAFSRSSSHMKRHLAASQKHNTNLSATFSLTSRRVAGGSLGDVALPTPKRVCGGDTHLSGASQLTSLPSRLSGATHLPALRCVFLVTPTACPPCACVLAHHPVGRQHATCVGQPAYLRSRQLVGFLTFA